MKFTAFELGQRSPADVVVTGNVLSHIPVYEANIRAPMSEGEMIRRAGIVRQAVRKSTSSAGLAGRLGLHPSHVSAWANGRAQVPDKYLPDLIRIAFPGTYGEVAV